MPPNTVAGFAATAGSKSRQRTLTHDFDGLFLWSFAQSSPLRPRMHGRGLLAALRNFFSVPPAASPAVLAVVAGGSEPLLTLHLLALLSGLSLAEAHGGDDARTLDVHAMSREVCVSLPPSIIEPAALMPPSTVVVKKATSPSSMLIAASCPTCAPLASLNLVSLKLQSVVVSSKFGC